MLSLNCTWWLPPACHLYSIHVSVSMILFTNDRIVQLKILNNKRGLLDHLTEKSRGREDFRHSSIRVSIEILCESFSSVPLVSFIFSVTSFMGANGSHPHIIISRARRHLCPRIPNPHVELQDDWITSEQIHSFLRKLHTNEKIALFNHYGKWK